MRFKKGSAAAKAFMAKLRAARGKKKVTPKKKTIGANYSMFSKEGNKKVTELVKHAIAKKLNRLQVSQKLNTLANTHPEALDTAVREDVYEAIFVKTAPNKKIGTVKKKAAKKKAAPGTHKDSKSHNVRISVMSGTTKSAFDMQKIWQNVYGKLSIDLVTTSDAKQKQKIRKEISVVKLILKDIKKFKGI